MAVRKWMRRVSVALAMVVGLSNGMPAWAFEGLEGDRPMTRRELLTVFHPMVKRLEAQGTIARSLFPSVTTFADLEGQEREWAIELSGEFLLFVGIPALSTGRFNPSLPVSRWEAVLIVDELLRRSHPDALKPLPQVDEREFSDLTPAERRRLQSVVRFGLFVGYPDQTFRTQESLTHAQWARVSALLEPLGRFHAPPTLRRKGRGLMDEFQLLASPRAQ